MFDFLKKPKGDAKTKVPDDLTIDSNNTSVDKLENVPVTVSVPQPPPAEIIPYNDKTRFEIDKRIECFLKLNPERPYNLQPIKFDREKKCCWKYADRIGIPSDSEVTEEEFWLAYIKGYVKNVLKDEKDKKTLLHNSQAIGNTNALIDQQINPLNGVSVFISGMNEKINSMDARQQEFVKGMLSQLDENPVLKMVENTFVFEGKEYLTTPKRKRILFELSKGSGWTTAKKLSEHIHESEASICRMLLRLLDKEYPIISYTAGGKRFWALEKGHKEKGKKGNTTPENKSALLVDALRQYKELNGRPPTATEISDQLKWDIFYVKNELKSLHLSGKIKMEKMVINWKKIKVWTVEEK